MKKPLNARQMSQMALMTALESALLYISALLPSARLAVVAVSGIVSVAAVISFGVRRALLVYAAAALLSALIVPDKGNVLLFAVFFGYYPIVKSIFERPRGAALRWTLKILLFNAAYWALLLFARLILFTDWREGAVFLLSMWHFAVAAFIIYDIGLSKLISYYAAKISKYIGR